MLKATWNSLSLRQSLAASMALMLMPLLVSAIAGYIILNRIVIADYRDVADRQHTELVPIQGLQVVILQAELSLEEYLRNREPERLRDYRLLQQAIEVGFTQLTLRVKDDGALAPLLERAWADWIEQEAVVSEALAAKGVNNERRLVEARSKFGSFQARAYNMLAAMYRLAEVAIEVDYVEAGLGFERSGWIAGFCSVISLLFMAAGLRLIGRTLHGSVERLVVGAQRFSEGDRQHRIEILVPPELHKVAEEFNRMIAVIHASEDRLMDQARRDKLTGLLNRRAFDEMMVDVFQRLQRNGEKVGLIALDIDHFKRVNDAHGHDCGDEVLRNVAKTILASLRSLDRVFRTGGEEFSIVLPGADDSAARSTAERIRQAVEALEIATPWGKISVTVSQGFALGTSAADTPSVLTKTADIALYQSKAAGRNTVSGMSSNASPS